MHPNPRHSEGACARGNPLKNAKAPLKCYLQRRFCTTRVYKPGSVLTAIYLVSQLLTRSSHLLEAVGPTYCFSTVLLRIEFTAPQCSHGAGGLLPHLFILTFRRYLSVALVLRSPSAGVTRYPCPAEPGLSSQSAFRHLRAAVRPGRCIIVTYEASIVKPSCKISCQGLYYL